MSRINLGDNVDDSVGLICGSVLAFSWILDVVYILVNFGVRIIRIGVWQGLLLEKIPRGFERPMKA